MQREELYHKTVDILYQAYFNDTLEHGNYCGCAVGNIVAANIGISPKVTAPNANANRVTWNGELSTGECWYSVMNGHEGSKRNRGIEQINATGYSVKEIMLIERAFERERYHTSDLDERMFKGLCQVLNTLKEIHEVEDNQPEVTRFKQHYASLT